MEEETTSLSPTAATAPASLGTRVLAGLIDYMVFLGVILLLGYILPGFLSKIAWLAGLGYLLTKDSLPFLKGRSIGKTAMKIQAVDLEGRSLAGNWEKGLIRNAVLMIPFFPLVELIVLATREGKPDAGRRLGDDWAKTKVVPGEV